MSHRIDLTGKRFGAWKVIRHNGQNHNRQTVYWCRCDCGTEREVVAQPLRSGLTNSCGCQKPAAISRAKTKHGHSRSLNGGRDSRTYTIWQAMHNRCRGGTEAGRKYYVPYGVKVCERWSSFENFLADMGEAPDKMSIDRYPNKDGDYGPGNCRWATAHQQGMNRRSSGIEKHTRNAGTGRFEKAPSS